MTCVLSVSSGRSDVGILAPVWRALDAEADIDLHVYLTGMHQADGAPDIDGLPAAATVHRGGADLGGADGAPAAAAMSEIAAAAGQVYHDVTPDLVMLIGDRLDMLPAATASLPFNLPLVHLHGGEVTLGAIDDRVRHAVSKLAHIHCVASPGARERLLAIGEEDWRIQVTGGPGLDTLVQAHEMSAEEFAAEFGFDDIAGLRLVTVHPETNSAAPRACLDTVLDALDSRPGPTLLTAPNSDPGGQSMKSTVQAFAGARSWAQFVDTLGSRLYPNALRHAAVMMGNSSSGIIEAGLFGLPVVNVGDRQMGREQGANVVNASSTPDSVLEALDRALARSAPFPKETPYGDGRAATKIAAILADLPGRNRLTAKQFPAGLH